MAMVSVAGDEAVQSKDSYKLVSSLEENIQTFCQIFKDNDLLIVRRFQSSSLSSLKCGLIYFDGMAKSDNINQSIIKPILSYAFSQSAEDADLLQELQYKVLPVSEMEMVTDLEQALPKVISGYTLLMIEGYKKVLIIATQGWKSRSLTEPESAKVVRGPREGFNESLLENLSLIQKRVLNPDLKFKFMQIGTVTHTKICIGYIQGLAQDSIIQELIKRIKDIQIDAILDSGYIQELIRDNPISPFETVGYSERPDVVTAKILEGRVAIFVEGSPFVLTVPFILAESFQSNEDYYSNYIFASINRLIRTIGAILCISLPSLYLVVTTFHQEFIPTPLLLSVSASRENVPFPTFLSTFMMLLVFDILREAGTRMPVSIGQAINIVGSLVLGQAAVEARLVSAPIVIITALTGILTLLNTSLIGPIVFTRFFLLLCSSVTGVYGFILGFFIVIVHVINLRSFGVPYLLNMTQARNHNGQDAWIRAPWWSMTLRPKMIGTRNLIRQKQQRFRGK